MTAGQSNPILPIIGALDKISGDVSRLATQIVNTPVKFTVAGAGFLLAGTSVGATAISVSTIPSWAGSGDVWVIIDAGTVDAEIRKLGSVSGDFYSVSPALDYAHAENDTVIFVSAPIANVRHWGAVGDDSTDDLIPFQRACAQANKISPLVVYVPGSTYRLSGTVTMYGNTEFCGDGKNISLLRSTNSNNNDTLSCAGASNAFLNNVSFHDFGMTTITSTGDAIVCTYINGVTVDDVYVYGYKTGVHANSCNRVTYTRNYAENCTQVAFRVSGIGTHENFFNVANNIAYNCGSGFSVALIDGGSFTGNVSFGNFVGGGDAFTFSGCSYLSITGNVAYNSLGYGFSLNNLTRCAFVGNVASNNTTASVELLGTSTGSIMMAGNDLQDTVKIVNSLSTDTNVFNTDVYSFFVPAAVFNIGSGAPTREQVDLIDIYTLHDNQTDMVATWSGVPFEFTRDKIAFYVHYAAATATTGNFRVRMIVKILYSNINHVNLTGGGGSFVFDCPASSTLNYVMITAAPTTYTCIGKAHLGIKVSRLGSDGNDTATGNMWFMGVDVARAGY